MIEFRFSRFAIYYHHLPLNINRFESKEKIFLRMKSWFRIFRRLLERIHLQVMVVERRQRQRNDHQIMVDITKNIPKVWETLSFIWLIRLFFRWIRPCSFSIVSFNHLKTIRKIKENFSRTPPPPTQSAPIDPLRVRLFPDDSDEETRDQPVHM